MYKITNQTEGTSKIQTKNESTSVTPKVQLKFELKIMTSGVLGWVILRYCESIEIYKHSNNKVFIFLQFGNKASID